MRPFLLASIESTLAFIASPLGIVSLLILIIGGYHLFRWAYDEIFFRGYVLGIYEPPLPNVHDLGQHSLSDLGDFGPHSFPDLDDFREIGRALAWGFQDFIDEQSIVTLELDEESDDDDRFDDDFVNEYR